ncbi:hypothetical protein ES703_14657 [subsurface metagenome]
MIAMVHRVLPQLQILQVDTGTSGYGAKRVLDSLDIQAGRICQYSIHSPQQGPPTANVYSIIDQISR